MTGHRCKRTGLDRDLCWCRGCRRRRNDQPRRHGPKLADRPQPDAAPPTRKGTTLD